MHKSLVSRPLSDLYALKTKKKMKTKALLKGAFVFTSWTKFYLLYENYDCKIKISIYLTIYFLRTSTSVAISENTRPLYIKKNLEDKAYDTFSVYVCAKERGWRESKLHLPKANEYTYSRDLYLYKSGQICRTFLFTLSLLSHNCNTVFQQRN